MHACQRGTEFRQFGWYPDALDGLVEGDALFLLCRPCLTVKVLKAG